MNRIYSSNSIDDYRGYQLHKQFDDNYVVCDCDENILSESLSYAECCEFVDELVRDERSSKYSLISEEELQRQYDEATEYRDYADDKRYRKKFIYYGDIWYLGRWIPISEIILGESFLITAAISEKQAFNQLYNRLRISLPDLIRYKWYDASKYRIDAATIVKVRD